MMKLVLSVLFLAGSATTALAQINRTTQDMTCGQVVQEVRTRGAVVLHTTPTTYDRYVSGPGYCFRDQMTMPVWVRTADKTQCFIGYRCRPTDLDNGR